MAIPTKPAFLPNMKKVATPATPVAPAIVEEPVVEDETTTEEEEVSMETEVTEAPVKEKKTRQKRQADGERKTPNRQMTNEDIQYIVANVKTMSYTEMADARELTKHQVNRVLMDVKKNLKTQAAGDPNKLAAVEAYIKEHLSRPEDALMGGRKNPVVREGIDSVVAGILDGI